MITLMIALSLFPGRSATTDPGDSCLTTDGLVEVDRSWEQAVLHQDTELLQALVADSFVWVHNHASQTDSKESLLRDVAARDPAVMHSRESSDVDVRILGRTGVVTGFTVVIRDDATTRYNFMRTYVESSGRCFLLSNHTMAIPEGSN